MRYAHTCGRFVLNEDGWGGGGCGGGALLDAFAPCGLLGTCWSGLLPPVTPPPRVWFNNWLIWLFLVLFKVENLCFSTTTGNSSTCAFAVNLLWTMFLTCWLPWFKASGCGTVDAIGCCLCCDFWAEFLLFGLGNVMFLPLWAIGFGVLSDFLSGCGFQPWLFVGDLSWDNWVFKDGFATLFDKVWAATAKFK